VPIKMEIIIFMIFEFLLSNLLIAQNKLLKSDACDFKNKDTLSNIIDYNLNSYHITDSEISRLIYNITIKAEVNGFNPIVYQLNISKNTNVWDKEKDEPKIENIRIIFEHPLDKSVFKQVKELRTKFPRISYDEILSLIKMRKDTLYLDNEFKYIDLIKKIDTLKIPMLFPELIILDGTKFKITVQTKTFSFSGEYPFIYDNEFSNWVVDVIKSMVYYFEAIDPYKDYLKDN